MYETKQTLKNSQAKPTTKGGKRGLDDFLADIDQPNRWSLYGGVTPEDSIFLAALPNTSNVIGLKPKHVFEASIKTSQHPAWMDLWNSFKELSASCSVSSEREKLWLPAWNSSAPAPQTALAENGTLPVGAYQQYKSYPLRTYLLSNDNPAIFTKIANWCTLHKIEGLGSLGKLLDLAQRITHATETATAAQRYVMFSRGEFIAAQDFSEVYAPWTHVLPDGATSFANYMRAIGRTGETICGNPYDLPEWIPVPDVPMSLTYQSVALFRTSPELLMGPPDGEDRFREYRGHPVYANLSDGERYAVAAISLVSRIVCFWAQDSQSGNKKVPILSRDVVLQAMERRKSVGGFLTILSNLRAGRPHGEPTALLLKENSPVASDELDSSLSQVHGRLAVMLPQVAMLTDKQRSKTASDQVSRYMTLSSLLQPLEPLSPNRFWPETQALVPQGVFWNALSLFQTVVQNPADFCNFSVFIDGSQIVSHEAALSLGKTDPNSDRRPAHFALEDLAPYFMGAQPVPILPGKIFTRRNYHTNYLAEVNRPKDLTRIFEANTSEVYLQTRFRLKDLAVAQSSLEAIAKALGHYSENNSDEVREDFRRIEFLPEIILMVGGKELSEADWVAAKLIEGLGYRIQSTGQLVTKEEYQAKTDMLVLRKRVLQKFTQVRIGDIWRLQNTIFKETAAERSKLSPDEYLRDLILQVDPVFSRLDAVTPLVPKTTGKDQLISFTRMRTYQSEGVMWAYKRLLCGFGVCFADEMGLGKTLQAIGTIQLLRKANTRILIATPKTLVTNWQREFSQFAPELRVASITSDAWSPDTLPDCDVLLTSYPRLRVDADKFAKCQWRVVVIDEAHTIKNSHTLIAKAVKNLTADFRIALTGTPIENHPRELWSLMDWLNEGFLGNLGDFVAYTECARTGAQRNLMLEPLRRALSPFILRRTKSDPKVALNLPAKIHKNHVFALADGQAKIYREIVRAARDDASLASSLFAQRSLFLKALLHLKQLCNHPNLFFGKQSLEDVAETFETVAGKRRQSKLKSLLSDHMLTAPQFADGNAELSHICSESTKFEVFRDLVVSLRDEARGILIFTQYIATANLLQRVLRLLDEPAYGDLPLMAGHLSMAERQDMIDSFHLRCSQVIGCRENGQESVAPILLMSLKTGGVGLNLTGADHVIHFDRWWNPAVEDQASDRAHRIGQDRSVVVHNLTAEGTIEEAIATLFGQKRQLAEDLLGAGEVSAVQEAFKDTKGFLELTDPRGWFSETDQSIHEGGNKQ